MNPRYHIIFDIENVGSDIIGDEPGLEQFMKALPPLIGMQILYGPIVKSGVPANPGLSAFEIIDYSHISVHTFSSNNSAMVDIFSCKPFEQKTAQQAVFDYFKVEAKQVRLKLVYWG